MLLSLDLLTAFIHGLGILSIIAIAFGTFERLPLSDFGRSVLEGALFGIGAIAAMLAPAQLADGVLVDLRSIIVGLGAAFAGWPGAIISMIFAAGSRLWLGGPTAIAGALGIAYAAVAGVVWAKHIRRPGRTPITQFLLFGLILSAHIVFLYSVPTLPSAKVTELWLFFSVASMLAAVTLGTLMCRERHFMLRERMLREESATDALTGLLNRRAFDKIMDQRMAEEALGRRSFSLLIVDADHFKMLNDTFGHMAGDDALRALSKALSANLRHEDVAARLGGEEFGVILRTARRDDAIRMAEKIRIRIAGEGIQQNGQLIRFTVSIGVACSCDSEANAGTLFEMADRALYRAKQSGRNRVEASLPSANLAQISRQIAALSAQPE
ncbi:diguanylate cyclase [Fulvimarina manganoxydans]|uniref:diguanylate cyclase n=1 Tax=Fulvimarina manganoxydans TaxID=937218 RepID=A0A1W2D525_9HYPH|nr:diguanylate cyclase [Fulvimarina manganoxydans]